MSRRCHRPRLVDAKDDIFHAGTPDVPAITHQPLRHDRLIPLLAIAEDCARSCAANRHPQKRWPARAPLLVQRTTDRLDRAAFKPLQQIADHFGDNLAGRLPRLFRHRRAQRDEIGDQMDVRLDSGQELGLQQHLLQAKSLERIALHHLHDARRKELADIAEPPYDSRGAEPVRVPRRFLPDSTPPLSYSPASA